MEKRAGNAEKSADKGKVGMEKREITIVQINGNYDRNSARRRRKVGKANNIK